MKTKMQKYESIRNWARGCKNENRRCQKQARPSPAQNFIFFLQLLKIRARLYKLGTSCIRDLLQKHTTSNLLEILPGFQKCKQFGLTIKDKHVFLKVPNPDLTFFRDSNLKFSKLRQYK